MLESRKNLGATEGGINLRFEFITPIKFLFLFIVNIYPIFVLLFYEKTGLSWRCLVFSMFLFVD